MGETGWRPSSPRDCYLCLSPLTGEARSEEHIIPNALGGRCSSYDLLCRDCNNSTGQRIDAELASQLLPVANLLGIKRERGKVPNVIVKRESGEELVRDSSGNMRPRRTSVASRLEGSTLRFEASGGVLPQNVVRGEMMAPMTAKASKRREFGPSRALLKVRNVRARQGIVVSHAPARAAQAYARRSLWDVDFRSGCTSRVAMMQPADPRDGDDFPFVGGFAVARLGGVLVEREVGSAAVIVVEVLPQDAA